MHLWVAGVALGVAAVALFCFNPAEYAFYPFCVFHRFTGLLCPGCGSLRALHHLLHGHVSIAFRFNPLLVISLPVVCGWALVGWFRAAKGKPLKFAPTPVWIWLLVAVLLTFTVWRNIPGTLLATLPQ
jgi:hypothetical protein